MTEVKVIKEWKIMEWTGWSSNPVPMTAIEITEARNYLRENHYPKPSDCPWDKCPGFRPACHLGVCYVSVRLCGDF
jgi:hypothetical protein